MTIMNAKVTAVILAVIIVAAGAVVYLTRDDSSGDITPGKLLIYGNADGDYDIDQDDVAYLEDIIAGKKEKTDMADANCDGDINQEDIDLVKKLINKVPCTAYYYDQQNKCHESFSYPIKNIYPVSIDSMLATKILGLDDNVVAVSSTTSDAVLFKDIYDRNVPGLGSNPSVEKISELKVKPDAIISNTYPNNVTNEAALEAAQIKVIRLAFEAQDNLSAYLTYGFMTQATERADKFAQFTEDVLSTIAEKTKDLTKEQRVSGMVLGYNVIYGKVQNYGTILTNAGGIDAVDWDAYRLCSAGYDWLYEYKFDYIVGLANPAGYDYTASDSDKANCQDIWNKHYDRYQRTDAVKAGHLFVLDNNMPCIIKTAYVAQMFYPDLFDSDFGNQIHQKYIDLFIDNLAADNYDVSSGVFVLTSDFVKSL